MKKLLGTLLLGATLVALTGCPPALETAVLGTVTSALLGAG